MMMKLLGLSVQTTAAMFCLLPTSCSSTAMDTAGRGNSLLLRICRWVPPAHACRHVGSSEWAMWEKKHKTAENNKCQIITLSGRALGILHACKQCSSSSSRVRVLWQERERDVEGWQ
jgi:hypothetical protein